MKEGWIVAGFFLGILMFSVFASAAVVSHTADQIVPGEFGGVYTGNWSFVNGRVGIGTTQPLATLHVNGSTPVGAEAPNPQFDKVVIDDNSYSYINFRTSNTGASGLIFSDDNRATAYINYNHGTQDFTIVGGPVGIGAASLGYKLYVKGNASINDSFYVTNAGRVGIGTATPEVKLDVKGIIRAEGAVSPNVSTQGAYIGWNALTGGTGETDFINNKGGGGGGFAFMDSNSLSTALMFIQTNGNVGIGTTSPGKKLSVTSGDSAVVNIYSNGGSVGVLDAVDPVTPTTGRWLSINPTGGSVGIGTTSPGAALEVDKSGDQGTVLGKFIGTTYNKESVIITSCAANNWGSTAAALYVGRNTGTDRSINAAGSINANGADYSEKVAWTGVKPEPGTIIKYKGSYMVVSDPSNIAFSGGDELEENESIQLVFVGQIKTKINGTANVGDWVIPTDNGYGIAVNETNMTLKRLMKSIGKVWEAKNTTGIGKVNVAIGLR